MLGSHPISAILGADIKATSDTSDIRAYLKGLTEVGLHVLFCRPGTKEPLDLRSKKQIEDDNEEYREYVRQMKIALDQPVDENVIAQLEAPGGVHLATNDLKKLRLYVNKFRKAFGDGTVDKDGNVRPMAPVTFAVSVGPSKLLIVDCDTEAQRLAFGQWMAERSGRPELAFTAPTVMSPGVCRDGQWVHRDGGHFYFAVGDIELPTAFGSMQVTHNGESFDIIWRDKYILIPPSERAEGRYERLGPVLNLSDHLWMKAAIDEYSSERAARLRDRGDESLPPEVYEGLIEWYRNTSWESLLIPEGWERTGVDSTCGCEQWGRPGRSSDKSATAHVPGCTRLEYLDSPDPPIHFWTQFPGKKIEDKLSEVGGRTLSKLQLLAALEYDGHDFLAMNSITELPSRVNVIVIEIGGVKVGSSTDMPVYDVNGDHGELASDVLDAPNLEPAALPYEGQPSVPFTAAITSQMPVVSAPTSATSPATSAPAPTPAPTHVGVSFGVSGSVSENLVGPAASNIIAANTNFQDFATNPATPVATGTATEVHTAPATPSATVESTQRYEQRYETTVTGSPWDTEEDRRSTQEIVAQTIQEMTPVITASIIEALKAQGIIPS